MNREPDRPIEQALREYGQSRAQQAAPAELHPATRAMLQAEVHRAITQPLAASSEEATRNFARPFATTPHQPNWLARFWPRLAFGGTVLAAFALVLTFIQQDNRRTSTTLGDDKGWRGGPVNSASSPTAQPAGDFLGDRPPERAAAGEVDALAGRAGGEPVRFSAGGSTPQTAPGIAPIRDSAGKESADAYRESALGRVEREKLIAPSKAKNDNGITVATERLSRAPNPANPSRAPAGGAGMGGAGTGGFGGAPTTRGLSRPEGIPSDALSMDGRAPSAELPKLDKARPTVATVRGGAVPESESRREAGLSLAYSPGAPLPAAAAKADSAEVAKSFSLAEAKTASTARFKTAAPSAGEPLAQPTPPPALETGKPGLAGVQLRAEPTVDLARKTSVSAPITTLGGTAAMEGYFTSDKSLRQEFSQDETRAKFRRNLLSPPIPNILTNFRLESDGDRVVVTDADGSTYWGVVTPPTGAEALWFGRELGEVKKRTLDEIQKQVRDLPAEPASRARETDSKLKPSEVAPAATFYFRASGTNRTLNQPVVFTGVFGPQHPDTDAERKLLTTAGIQLKDSLEKNQFQRVADPSPAARPGAVPAQQPASRGTATLAPASGPSPLALGLYAVPTNAIVDLRQRLAPAAPRVQGTAVIGKDRIEINATPRK